MRAGLLLCLTGRLCVAVTCANTCATVPVCACARCALAFRYKYVFFSWKSTRHWICLGVCARERTLRWGTIDWICMRVRACVSGIENSISFTTQSRCYCRHRCRRSRIEFIAFEKWILIFKLEFIKIYYYFCWIAAYTYACLGSRLLLLIYSISCIGSMPRKKLILPNFWCRWRHLSQFDFALPTFRRPISFVFMRCTWGIFLRFDVQRLATRPRILNGLSTWTIIRI